MSRRAQKHLERVGIIAEIKPKGKQVFQQSKENHKGDKATPPIAKKWQWYPYHRGKPNCHGDIDHHIEKDRNAIAHDIVRRR